MLPVAAVSLVFALVLSAVLWVYLVRVGFAQSTVHGIVAIILPPIALLMLLPHWRKFRELFLLAFAALGFISLAAILG
ncbi:hypothetical protein [uncultured Microbulbifer sp.]|uniref:hypothetical protein n=1 Tax=uncultured Microbulbifer sp. TaxID=348147 RepID=UPI0025E6B98F|nr:hypothetical protein [uncultured Microbulbifer sp.]